MSKTHIQLREAFLRFWQDKNHTEVPPIPLVPKEDPTTLFTGSGMQQLIPYLQGETHPLGKRLWNIQPCFRSQDIEEVGDNRHTTFFEMMGNWSLGDYFKEEQLKWCWDFFTKVVDLPENKLYVTVFDGTKDVPKDDESYQVWKKIGVPKNKIFFYGVEHNWWSRSGTPSEMPPGEIGGPDSEVFYDFGEELKLHEKSRIKEKCHPNCTCGRFLEIGNSVFIQYKKGSDGKLQELPQKNVDYGGGLERLDATVQNDPDVFTTDLYWPVIEELEKQTAKNYSGIKHQSEMRVIADHLKAATFLIADGVTPSNKEEGYVLRRLLRRSAIKLSRLRENFASSTEIYSAIVNKILEIYEDIYFKNTDKKTIISIISNELLKFDQTLRRGLKEIEKIDKIDGKKAFDLYQSFGFPLEITEELLREKGQRIDKSSFYRESEKHKEISRKSASGRFRGGLADENVQTIKYHTATHLIHQALFDAMGKVRQEGSNITSERLRFDFFSEKRPSDGNIKKVENIVNQKIKEELPVRFEIMDKTKAEKIGALAFFKEKYADKVKVYFVGDYSKEFCGGPHVKNTKEIEKIKIYKFEKIGSNIYRIYAK